MTWSVPPSLKKEFLYLASVFIVSIFNSAVFAQESTLHKFITETGAVYYHDVATDNNYIYGTKFDGGSNGNGYVYRIGKDGSDFHIIYDLVNVEDGRNPVGGLIFHQGHLYGMTAFGGTHDLGVIFRLKTEGAAEYTTILNFDGTIGALPFSNLMISGDVVFGVSQQGGAGSRGTIFKVNIDGSNPKLLHIFNGNNGWSPSGKLTIIRNSLYGTTVRGGNNDYGVVFKIKTDGSFYQVLHHFNDQDGSFASHGVVTDGRRLYGTSTSGGEWGSGVIFKMDTTGYGYKKVDMSGFYCSNPNGLVLHGSLLYGMTTNGGNGSRGVVFSIDTTLLKFKTLQHLTSQDGGNPLSTIWLHGDELYAQVRDGQYNYGAIFKVRTDGTGFQKLNDFTSTNTGYEPRGLLPYKGKNYGVTQAGGKYNCGVIYRINDDGADFHLLHEFNGEDGKMPKRTLTLIDSTLFGVTFMGGNEGTGTLFKINHDGTDFEKLFDFSRPIGFYPDGSLVSVDSILYGLATGGGPENKGCIFKYDMKDRSYSTVIDFNQTAESFPHGSLKMLNNRLYGLAFTEENQTIYSVNRDGSDYKKIVEKDPVIGGRYDGEIIVTDSVIFGISRQGGTTDVGALYRLNLDGTGLTRIFDFHYNVAALPEPQLILSGDTLFGVASVGGTNRTGGVFGIGTDGSNFFYLTEASANGRIANSNRRATAYTASIMEENNTLFGASTADYGLTRESRLFSYDLRSTKPPSQIVTGLSEAVTLNIYPNPATQYLRIDGISATIFSTQISDMMGRVFRCDLAQDAMGYRCDVSDLPVGVYIFKAFTSSEQYVLKFIKR